MVILNYLVLGLIVMSDERVAFTQYSTYYTNKT